MRVSELSLNTCPVFQASRPAMQELGLNLHLTWQAQREMVDTAEQSLVAASDRVL